MINVEVGGLAWLIEGIFTEHKQSILHAGSAQETKPSCRTSTNDVALSKIMQPLLNAMQAPNRRTGSVKASVRSKQSNRMAQESRREGIVMATCLSATDFDTLTAIPKRPTVAVACFISSYLPIFRHPSSLLDDCTYIHSSRRNSGLLQASGERTGGDCTFRLSFFLIHFFDCAEFSKTKHRRVARAEDER